MLDFSKIGKTNVVYNILYDYVGLVYRFIYYRKFQVAGRRNIPRKTRDSDGFLVICNHQNGLLDALGIIWAVAPHKPVFIARGDLFRKENLGRMLRMLRILPAFRKREGEAQDIDKNEIVFQYAVNVMQQGGVVALFPEAGHQNRHFLGTFKKGFARIAFEYAQACDFQKDLTILPLGHNYSGYFGMQQDLLMTIGEPIHIADLYDTYRESPERARHLLNLRARERVESLMLNIEEVENYEAVDQMCEMYIPEYKKRHGIRNGRLKHQLSAKQALNNALKKTGYGKDGSDDAAAAAGLIAKAAEYVKNLKTLRLDDRIVDKANVGGFIARTLLWIALLPFFIASALINVVPAGIGAKISSKAKDRMLVPSFRFGVGLVSYLIWYLLLFAAIWIIFKKFWIAAVSLLLMPVTLLVYHNARALGSKLICRIRKISLRARRDPLYEATVTLRRDIMSGIGEIMK
ncbi:MAG: 1-acyl-sn-glycerol-3-phosphate acyltransferase [Bacteroidales bacterium]|nr:1-acyl-sn-glycerol-3-phosphate acyltransferase [Bacteroidales bacterium]MBQ9529598.1 1-acyl-sn-glycerol-3-phosphate acyltransferase [Bacteroidales bacterium]